MDYELPTVCLTIEEYIVLASLLGGTRLIGVDIPEELREIDEQAWAVHWEAVKPALANKRYLREDADGNIYMDDSILGDVAISAHARAAITLQVTRDTHAEAPSLYATHANSVIALRHDSDGLLHLRQVGALDDFSAELIATLSPFRRDVEITDQHSVSLEAAQYQGFFDALSAGDKERAKAQIAREAGGWAEEIVEAFAERKDFFALTISTIDDANNVTQRILCFAIGPQCAWEIDVQSDGSAVRFIGMPVDECLERVRRNVDTLREETEEVAA